MPPAADGCSGLRYVPACSSDPTVGRMARKTFLEKRGGVPVLAVHSEYGESDLGQVRTRVEAFVEIIR